MSHIEQNKSIAQRWLELISQQRIDELCELTAPCWTMYGGPPALPAGPAGVRALFRSTGPVHQTWIIEEMIAEGNLVVTRATNTCRQESFFGIPAARHTQKFSAIFIHKIVGGKIMVTWRNADDLGRVLQLGARIETAA